MIFSPVNFIVGIVLFGCLLFAAIIFHFNGLYGQDGHEYLRLTRALNQYFLHGTNIDHSYFPIFYPAFALLLSGIIWNDIAAMQLVSMIALVGSFIYLKKLLQLIHIEVKQVNAFLIAFFFFSPYVFRFGLLAMSDMFCLFFVIGSVYYALRYIKLTSLIDAAMFACFAATAIETRYAVLVLFLVPGFVMLKSMLVNKNFKAIGIALFAFGMVLLPDWLIRGRVLFLTTEGGNFMIDYASNAYSWSPLNFFAHTFENPDGKQQYDFWNIIAATFNVIHPAFLFTGLAFIFFYKRSYLAAPEMKMILWMVVVYGFFIAGLHYQNNRYLLQSFPFVLVIFYPSFLRILKRYLHNSKIQQSSFVLIILIQILFFWYSFQKIHSLNATEKEIAKSLKSFPGQTVYTCSIVGALSSYEVDNQIIDLYFHRITKPIRNSLLIFNYQQFSQHFEDRNPMYNWKLLNEQNKLKIIRSFPDGWVLYSIENKL